jgi:hypothetical protein
MKTLGVVGRAAVVGVAVFLWLLGACDAPPDTLERPALCYYGDRYESGDWGAGPEASEYVKSLHGCDTCIQQQCGDTMTVSVCSKCTQWDNARWWIGNDAQLVPPTANWGISVHRLRYCARMIDAEDLTPPSLRLNEQGDSRADFEDLLPKE